MVTHWEGTIIGASLGSDPGRRSENERPRRPLIDYPGGRGGAVDVELPLLDDIGAIEYDTDGRRAAIRPEFRVSRTGELNGARAPDDDVAR